MIVERAVFSWWSAPGGLPDAATIALGELSVRLAARHFREVELITDSRGAPCFAGWPFTRVRTLLDALPASHAAVWSLGKIAAAVAQDAPFVHVDFDALIWAPLPHRLLTAASFAERPQTLFANEVRAVLGALASVPSSWLPPGDRAVVPHWHCGIFGAVDCTGLAQWGATVRRVVEQSPPLRHAPPGLAAVVLEQYTLRCHFPNAATLFPSPSPTEAEWAQARYSHFVGSMKRDPALLARVRERLRTGNLAPRLSPAVN